MSPTCLGHFIRWLGQDTILICVTVMQFKVHLLNVGRQVFVAVRLQVDGPVVRMSVLLTLLAKELRNIAVHNRHHNGLSFHPTTGLSGFGHFC